MGVKVTGVKPLRQALSRQTTKRIATAAARAGAQKAFELASRRGFGFDDRTGRLRSSLTIEQARDSRGRFTAGFELVSRVRYAPYVEFKRRTRDRRRRVNGGYWLRRLTRDPYKSQIEEAAAQAAGKAIDETLGG